MQPTKRRSANAIEFALIFPHVGANEFVTVADYTPLKSAVGSYHV